MKKVHFLFLEAPVYPEDEPYEGPLCNNKKAIRGTEKPKHVTCKHCLRLMPALRSKKTK